MYIVLFQPMRGIKLLVNAIDKIQLFPAQLTSIHADLCQVIKGINREMVMRE